MKSITKYLSIATIIIFVCNLACAMPSYEDVLVVVNTNSADSVEIGKYFQQQRNIPDKNICTVSVTDLQATGAEDGMMTIAEKQSMLDAIKKHLADNNLTDKINYIVMTRGIPYFAANDMQSTTDHLTDMYLLFNLSESATDSKIPDVFSFNKYFYYIDENYNNISNYKFTRNKYGYYMVARLDGPGTVNVKKLIDNTGYPAYSSYKKGIKYLTLTPYYSAAATKEIQDRGNIQIVSPDMKNGQDLREVSKDIMFAYYNGVNFDYRTASSVTALAPYTGAVSGYDPYYADLNALLYCPPMYHYTSFLPGSIICSFRSFTAHYAARQYGSAAKINISNIASAPVTDFRKRDGSDMKFLNMTCVEYDPVNKWLWCGAGGRLLNTGKNCGNPDIALATHQKFAANCGGGIGIFNPETGEILNHFEEGSSPLLNNRITKIVYDKYANYIWVAHFKGVQYYDLANKTWNEIPEFKSDYAATAYVYVDPFDTDKVYFSFCNVSGGDTKNLSSIIPGAFYNVFEYSKSKKTVTAYPVETTKNLGPEPLIVKTSATTLWVTRGIHLDKYDLATKTKVKQIVLQNELPEVKTPPTGATVTMDYMRCLLSSVNSKGESIIFAGMACNIVGGSTPERKNYILRITIDASGNEKFDTFNHVDMNEAGTGSDRLIYALIESPTNKGTFFVAVADALSSWARIFKSSDGDGATWERIYVSKNSTVNLRDIAVNGNDMYMVRGSENVNVQQISISDLIVRGVCAYSGGMSHSSFVYNPATSSVHMQSNYYPMASASITPYSASTNSNGDSQATQMMFMMLDGYYTGEARFGIMKQYPCSGGAGYEGHMLVFEPKCAPFAPRVDEENLNSAIIDQKSIEIPLRSPGLPVAMDSFIPETINNSTISVKDSLGSPVAATVEYKATGNKIVLAGDFSGSTYLVTLKCGVDGIKNTKGASLTNTRANEFKDEITYTFGAGGIPPEIYTPPTDVTGPVKMPSSSSKCDLIVSSVKLAGAPVAGQPLTVNFVISNIGTVKTAAGSGAQKAKVYVNNVLADSKTYDDIAPRGKIALTATIPGSSVVSGKQCKVMVWADSTEKVTEIRETNNTNSASFFIETRPDLIVKEITLSPKPKAKAPLTINFKISNIGAGATVAGANEQTATVLIDGKTAGSVNYSDIAKGGSVVMQLALPSGIATAGVHKIKVSADANKVVGEINDNNNSLEKNFAIAK